MSPLQSQCLSTHPNSSLDRFARTCLPAAFTAAVILFLFCSFARPASADLSTVYQFTGRDGSSPNGLILGRDGNFYGTTEFGGSTDLPYQTGDGAVFKVTPQGVGTKLFDFDTNSDTNAGQYPVGSLLQARDGSFYGVTAGGGIGSGTLFRFTTDGTAAGTKLTTLVNFGFRNGGSPRGGLIQARDGSFYGTTYYGGENVGLGGGGTVFRLTTDGTAAGTTLTTLYKFRLLSGFAPAAPLLQVKDGSFYGTTSEGGTDGGTGFGNGTVFRLTTDGTAAGTKVRTLYSFHGPDGSVPTAALIQASDGSFYGTTSEGGTGSGTELGNGTVFRFTTDGEAAGTDLTTLFSFPANGSGNVPLIQARDGSFYGTTDFPGYYGDGYGTVFRFTTDGTAAGTDLTTVFGFDGDDGIGPSCLLQTSDGSLYGTTLGGGAGFAEGYEAEGTVFHLTLPPLAADPIESLTLTPTTVLGGNIVTGEVTLRNIATVPQTVTLASSGPALRVPASVTITPGHRHALFTAQTRPVSPPVIVTVTATSVTATGDNGSGPTKSVTVLVTPSPLLSVTATPASLVGGSANAAGEVALKDIAREPIQVVLTSSAPSVLSVRYILIVTPGHRHALFTLVSHPVTTPQTVTITAVANGVTKTTTVTVTP